MRLENAYNFRDVGGLPTTDGRTVATGRLYRSDGLHRITGADLLALGTLGIRTVVDLRRPHEIEADGRMPELAGATWYNIHPVHREWDWSGYDATAGSARYLADRYLDMVDEGAAGLGSVLRMVADPDAAAIVVHCMAGKDRTGVVVALALSLVGVDDATIAADYARSAAIQGRIAQRLRRDHPDRELPALPDFVLAAPAEAMLLFLAGLRDRYGSVAAATATGGVDGDVVTALRSHLLGSVPRQRQPTS